MDRLFHGRCYALERGDLQSGRKIPPLRIKGWGIRHSLLTLLCSLWGMAYRIYDVTDNLSNVPRTTS
jgi:hypothetical protein